MTSLDTMKQACDSICADRHFAAKTRELASAVKAGAIDIEQRLAAAQPPPLPSPPPATKPTAPTGLKAIPNNGSVTLSWDPNPGDEQVDVYQVYVNDLEQAKLAEQVGLDSIWYSEHHFLNWNPNAMGICAAVAAVTSRIQLGPSVVLGPLHNPIKLAEECAMVDVLSNGRFTIGVGLGYRDVEYAGFNVSRARRAPMTEELVQVMKLAWKGEPVTFHGRFWDFKDVDVYPKPLQKAGPPVWIAGYIDASLDRAARLGDGWYAGVNFRLSDLPRQTLAYRAALADREGSVAVNRVTFVAETASAVDAEFARHLARVLEGSGKGGESARQVADEVALVGTPDHIVAQLERYHSAGVTHVFARLSLDETPPKLARGTIQLLGREVIPYFSS